ncbi:MAG: M56 family metallopeptidase [Candidatus Amulumruptor caecigallinarius]|nr:M56 family metallopeptidase [Candidatus Amulumruptor caecigallinarius]MCM1397121.1 M56 family metallopeptidase [Candidatus Amulumruptor caecigallinarius]MCM1453931.1 M56 family metallopeptidase [bacterium]
MGTLLSYSIYAGIFLAALYLTYKWVLAGEAQHAANRAILMFIYLTALVALPVSLAVKGLLAADAGGALPVTWMDMPVAVGLAPEADTLTVADVCLWIYLAGMVGVAAHTLYIWVRLARIVAAGVKRPCGRFTLVLTDRTDIAPFSWLRFIVMSRADYAEAGEMIVCHETRHLRLGHPVDLIVAQCVAIIEWWNPAAWLMREELKAVHEYQADRAVLTSGINARQYQLLLIKKAVGARFPSLANSLNHSKLKKRITMMYNQKRSGRRSMRALAMVPALAAAGLIGQIPAVATAMESAAEATLATPASVTAHKVNANPSTTQAPATDESPVDVCEVMPEFPGGIKALLTFLQENMRYPAAAEKAGKEGKVIVRFVVDKSGKPGEATVINSVDPELDAEALRVVSVMPDFTPGTVNGKPVSVYYTLPVNFRLMGKSTPSKKKTAASQASTATAGKSEPMFTAAVSTGPSNVTMTSTDGKREISLNGKPVSEGELESSGIQVIALGGGQGPVNTLKDATYTIDGKEATYEDIKVIAPSTIESMTINKKDGKPVISIVTKKAE